MQINEPTFNNYRIENKQFENENKQFKVLTIENGTVIDHIPKKVAFKLFKILNLASDNKIVSIGVNFPSQKVGTKNLIKIENKELTEKEVSILAIFAPDATINIIRNFKVYKKFKTVIPKEVAKLLVCPNPNCITNNEKMDSHFFINKNNLDAQCKYCEKIFHQNEIKKYKI
ncbi:MAG: aspartate carbamoyltransferase regulatory subunit [Candidatus Magasanikbacteria bacterium]|nr:aspartate carbamoyltransferase regulatory subunit [Candidatus Magasanikbacteria bacterium]